MKRTITLLLCVLMIFSLCACGREQENEGSYVATVKIGYWEAGYGEGFMNYWADEYNKAHPEEKIKFIIDPNVAASSIGTSLENSAGLCDIYFSLATSWAGWARSGWIEPLDDLYEMENDDGVKFKNAFIGGMETYGKLDGKQYVFPQSGPMANGFVYNETMFKEHNWIIPKTVDELYTLVDQINNDPVNKDSNPNNDIAPFAWGGQVMAYWNAVVQMWANQYDGVAKTKQFFQEPSLEQYKDRPGIKKALQVFQSLICTGEGTPKNSIQGAMGKNHLLMQNDFVLGKAAMVSGIYGIVNETKDIIDKNAVLKIFFPNIEGAETAEDGKPLRISVATEFDFGFVASASKVKEYAKKFLLWISTEDMARSYCQYTASNSPFKYDKSKLTGLNSLTQSSLEQTDDHFVTIVGVSDVPISQYGKITYWPAGEPYTSMVLNNASPTKIINDQYNFISGKWSGWCKEAGMPS